MIRKKWASPTFFFYAGGRWRKTTSMTLGNLTDQLEEIIRPIVLSEGMELVELEFTRQGQRWYLRIYIDKEDGVNLGDCENISRQVEQALDVEDPIPQQYVLEVSSPGLDRPLKQKRDFLRSRGKLIRLFTSVTVGGKRDLVGILKSIEEDLIQLELRDGETLCIPLADIAKARLEIEI